MGWRAHEVNSLLLLLLVLLLAKNFGVVVVDAVEIVEVVDDFVEFGARGLLAREGLVAGVDEVGVQVVEEVGVGGVGGGVGGGLGC